MEKHAIGIPVRMKQTTVFPILNNLLLLLLLYLFMQEMKTNADSQTFLKYNIPSDDYDDRFSGQRAIEKFQQAYRIKTLHFTGEESKNELILKRFAALLQKENQKKEATIIYRIYIPKSATYNRFISLLNLMKKEGYKRYMEWDNYFYVLTNNNNFRI